MDAASGDGGIRFSHLHGRHTDGAQRERRVGWEINTDAHCLGSIYDLIGSDSLCHLYESGIG